MYYAHSDFHRKMLKILLIIWYELSVRTRTVVHAWSQIFTKIHMSSKHNHKHNRNARPRVSACYGYHRGYFDHEKSINLVKLTTCWLGFYLKTEIYWKEKETNIHFECYLYQRCFVCVKESVFEMLNIHIWTHYDTFHWKQTTCVSWVHGKSDIGNASEIHAVCATIQRTDFSNALVLEYLV